MKRLNMILLSVLALLLLFIVFFHISGTLHAEVSCISAPASDYEDSFNSVIAILKSGTAPKTFISETPESTDGLYLLAATITLKNSGLFSAEWIEADSTGASGDIAVYSQSGTESDITAGGSGQIILKFLTKTPDEKRNVKISYYILGKQRTLTVSV